MPGSSGLRTPAGKCRLPGLKTDASALGKWLFGFSPEGGIGTAGVRKPPDREPPNTGLKPRGRHREGRLDFIFNAKYYFLANFL